MDHKQRFLHTVKSEHNVEAWAVAKNCSHDTDVNLKSIKQSYICSKGSF